MVSPEIHFVVYVAPPTMANNVAVVGGGAAVEQAVAEAQALLSRELDLTYSYPSTTRRGSQGGLAYRELYYQLPSGGYGSGSYAGKSVAARVYLVNGKVITLTAVGPRVKLDGADVVKFFNSVRFPANPPLLAPPPMKATMTTGKVSQTAWNRLTIKSNVPGGVDNVVIVPDDALVTVNGRAGTVQDIKVNSIVTITERGGKVLQVDVKSN